MYSESDLNAAVEAGVLSPQAVTAFRDHVAASRATPTVDEEHFRLLTGFNDIFVSIAAVLILVASSWIGGSVHPVLGGMAVAAASWGLAEYFTRERRMALPSILLLLGFVGGVFAALTAAMMQFLPDAGDQTGGFVMAGVALLTAGAAWLHWRRFMVPITVAAGALALVGVGVALAMAFLPGVREMIWPITLAGGVLVFAVAMAWDMSDLERRTRRADVAFWLHLAAAPLIAHSIFQMLGVFDGSMVPGMAVVVLALYVAFAVLALAIDRRALLVSSLAYVLYALYDLFNRAGAVELSAAFTALVIGSALLMLSAFWHPMRRAVIGRLGDLARRLPPVQQHAVAAA
jgi:LPXTG-motif cell wall-anchored protein